MKFTLDVPVEKRRVGERNAVVFDLEYPPSGRYPDSCKDWALRAGWEVVARRPGRMPGPVRIIIQFEERAGRQIGPDLVDPIVQLCVKHRVIDSDHRSVIREVNSKWGNVRGVRVTIEPAISLRDRAA